MNGFLVFLFSDKYKDALKKLLFLYMKLNNTVCKMMIINGFNILLYSDMLSSKV